MTKFVLHKFSTSTALGLTFGMLLAAYVVFAFGPPVQAPPSGMVPAPLKLRV